MRRPTRPRRDAGTKALTRRDWLAIAGKAVLLAPALLGRSWPAIALPDPPLPKLPDLDESEALLLRPGDKRYELYEPAHNKLTMLRPALRAMCKTPRAVAAMVDWVRDNRLPFAVRSGGHSYEGFSQSTSVVIDTRLMNQVAIDADGRSMTVGAGASLGAIYEVVGPRGLAFAAGTCPTVGISGHALGGGYGLLARPFGLTCDNLELVALVDAGGHAVSVDATEQPDLFWACRGGGGGSFGVATTFRFKLVPLKELAIFSVSWSVPIDRAVALFRAWQAWAPNAPDAITAVLRVVKKSGDRLAIDCVGQSIGAESQLARELRALTGAAAPRSMPRIRTMSFLDAAHYFSGGWNYQSIYMKAKSDYVVAPLDDAAVTALMAALLAGKNGEVAVLCDAYGGAIGTVDASATAFPRRAGTLYSVQYYASWQSPADTMEREAAVKAVYDSMRGSRLRRGLCELLRPRADRLGECLLGHESRAAPRDQEGGRSRRSVPACAKRALCPDSGGELRCRSSLELRQRSAPHSFYGTGFCPSGRDGFRRRPGQGLSRPVQRRRRQLPRLARRHPHDDLGRQGGQGLRDSLDHPDIDDMFLMPYRPGPPAGVPALNEDPGRVRYEPLFMKMYGDCKQGKVPMRAVAWMPSHRGGSIKFTTVNHAADHLEAVIRDLERLPAKYTKYLVPSSGTYNCRTIAGTNRRSMHAYGAAIDINTRFTDYWLWAKPAGGSIPYRNQIPFQIVDIFEHHGFIWGGKWYHYDTMHFEYRPELVGATAE